MARRFVAGVASAAAPRRSLPAAARSRATLMALSARRCGAPPSTAPRRRRAMNRDRRPCFGALVAAARDRCPAAGYLVGITK
jgi:hypothetical protein